MWLAAAFGLFVRGDVGGDNSEVRFGVEAVVADADVEPR